MLDLRLARAAFRARASNLVVVTTGSATLSATTSGYARSSGSFVTDGFVKGMEVVPAGFTQTTPGIVTAVTALTLTIEGGRTAQTSGSGRSLTVGLPLQRAWENEGLTPVSGRPFIEHDFVPGGGDLRTIPGRTGTIAEDGLSVWRWYGITGVGTDAIDAGVQALLALFTPATKLSLSNGQAVWMRGDVIARASQIVRVDSWAVCTVRIPWETRTRNAVAA